MKNENVVVIGTSAGGVQALQRILEGLGKDFPLPIAIVHHLPATATVDFKLAFGRFTGLVIRDIEDKTPIQPRSIYFAPPGYHLLIEKDGVFSLSVEDPVHHSRPSIDVLFSSAARSLGPRAIGILLTGANDDGADGLREIQDHGGYTIAENPDSAEFNTMPASALRIMRPNEVLDLNRISQRLQQIAEERAHG